ncbi:MAG: YjjG family noncanonical pyrimidine nucleotidase [bacterium]|nr:YjjG family noncanonical pyrimidine nucleotidase [bacterium]
MKEITTILLDVDGTLLDFNKAQATALERVFELNSLELTASTLALYNEINHGLWKQYELGEISRDTVLFTRYVRLFKMLDIPLDGVAFERQYQSLLAEGAYLLPGALPLVTYLSDHYDLYIVTNGVATTQHKRLEASGLDKFMKGIFISETLGYQKPDVRFFEKCYEEIPNADPDKMIIIGDTLSSDILGGNHAGITTCWYNPTGEENHTDAIVDLEIKHLDELYQYL